jgi:transposase
MNKKIIKQSIGIDISMSDFKVCLMAMDADLHKKTIASHSFANSESGFKTFVEWSSQKAAKEAAVNYTMEATGVYYEGLAYYLKELNFSVHVVLPNQSKKYGESLGVKSKTDKIDARILAQMGVERELKEWEPISAALLPLKQLTRERDMFVCKKTDFSNYLHALRHQGKPGESSIARVEEIIKLIKAQITGIEEQIAELVKKDAELERKLGYVQSIPGVGLLTAATVAAETNGFASFSSIRQTASYAGLDIKIRQSGKWKGKSKISKKGNSHIRKALYLPAFSKIRADKSTKEHYDQLVEKKGIKMVAAVAIQRKLLGLMYTLWKKEEMFRAAA